MNEIERKNIIVQSKKRKRQFIFSFALNDEAEGKKKVILQPNLSRFLDPKMTLI